MASCRFQAGREFIGQSMEFRGAHERGRPRPGKPTMVSMRTRPGRSLRTRMRSARSTASSTLCVTITVVGRLSSQMRSNSKFILRRVTASRAPKGSSRRSSLGFRASARAMATRWRMPPENSAGRDVLKAGQANQRDQLADALLWWMEGRRLQRADGDCLPRFARAAGRAPGRQCPGHAGIAVAGRLAVDLDFAGGRLVEPGQQVQDGAFAATGGTNEGYKLAVRHQHIDGAECCEGLLAARACPANPGSCHIA